MWFLAPKRWDTWKLNGYTGFANFSGVTLSHQASRDVLAFVKPYLLDTDALLPRQLPGSLARIPPGFSDNAQAMIWWGQEGAGSFQLCTDRMQRARHICSKGKLATWVPCDSPDALDSHFVLQNGALVEASQELRSYSSNICTFIPLEFSSQLDNFWGIISTIRPSGENKPMAHAWNWSQVYGILIMTSRADSPSGMFVPLL